MTDPQLDLEDDARLLEESHTEAWRRISRANHAARSDPYGMSLSSLGMCLRRAAYLLARVDPSDPELAWDLEDLAAYRHARGELPEVHAGYGGRQAMLGTLTHDTLLPVWAQVLGERTATGDGGDPPLVEHPVTMVADGVSIPGRVDLYVPARGLVVDLKTVGAGQLGRRRQPLDRELLQVGGYALGLMQAGHQVRAVAWEYLDRSDGRSKPVLRPFDRGLIGRVRARSFAALDWSSCPDRAPREHDGPGVAWQCDSCPFLRRCWGSSAVPGRTGPQGRLAEGDTALDATLARYTAVSQQVTALDHEKKALRAVIEGEDETGTPRRPGVAGAYGWRRGKPGEKIDQPEAVRRMEAAGLPVPMTTTEGRFQVYRAD